MVEHRVYVETRSPLCMNLDLKRSAFTVHRYRITVGVLL